MANKRIMQSDNYLFVWTNVESYYPVLFSKRNTIFDVNGETGDFTIKETGGGSVIFTAAQIAGGNILDDSDSPYTAETLFSFLTFNTSNFSTASGGSGANVGLTEMFGQVNLTLLGGGQVNQMDNFTDATGGWSMAGFNYVSPGKWKLVFSGGTVVPNYLSCVTSNTETGSIKTLLYSDGIEFYHYDNAGIATTPDETISFILKYRQP